MSTDVVYPKKNRGIKLRWIDLFISDQLPPWPLCHQVATLHGTSLVPRFGGAHIAQKIGSLRLTKNNLKLGEVLSILELFILDSKRDSCLGGEDYLKSSDSAFDGQPKPTN